MSLIDEEAYIFASMFSLSNRLQVLGDRLDPRISIKQWLFLVAIYKSKSETPTISEIARFIGNSRQNVKKMAILLEKQGFVELKRDDLDARAIRVRLTEKCGTYFSGRSDLEMKFLNDLFVNFDDDLVSGLFKGLNKLAENISEMEKLNEKEEF
jgi:DNA-binding MarR family transcriptional regulator